MYFDCLDCPMQYFYRQYSQGGDYYTTNSRPPSSPPPPFIPSKTQAMYQTWGAGPGAFMIIDPSVIQTHMFSYTYIWLKNGREFWAWINFVDGTFISGWIWNNSNWVPFRLEIRLIDGIARF